MIRKVLALVAVAMIASMVLATTASAQTEIKASIAPVSPGTAKGDITCSGEAPFSCTITPTGIAGILTASGVTPAHAPILLGYSEANCAAGKQIALLFDTNVPQNQGALLVEATAKTGALIVAVGIPAGNATAGPFNGPLSNIKSFGIIDFTAPLTDPIKAVVVGCGAVGGAGGGGGTGGGGGAGVGGGAGASPTAKPATTATVTGVSKTGTGYSDGSVWTWLVIAGFLAVTGGALVTVGAKARR